VLTNVMSGRPARAVVNRLIREVGPISDLAPEFPLAAGALVAERIWDASRRLSPLRGVRLVNDCQTEEVTTNKPHQLPVRV
jgi:hypothetical protein